MRLREIKDILEANVDDLKLVSKQVPNKNDFEISNLPELYESIMNISEFSFLDKDITKLEFMPYVFHNKNPKVIINNGEFNKMKKIIEDINMKTNAVILAISEAIPKQDENSISIRLPDFVDLNKVSKSIKEIDQILNQSLVGKYTGTVKLQNFDTGSNWIEVVLGNQEAILLFGSIVKGTYEFIKEEYLGWKQTKHQIELYDFDLEAKKMLLESMEQSVNAKARFHAMAISKEFEITENQAEYETGLTYSIITLAELIHEGAEVHTALNAPEESKEAYPETKELRSIINNATKLLPEAQSDIPIHDLEPNGEVEVDGENLDSQIDNE